jgi:hypothetical protein
MNTKLEQFDPHRSGIAKDSYPSPGLSPEYGGEEYGAQAL